MSHKTTIELPDDVWADMEKRKTNHEGSYQDLLVRAYKAYYTPAPSPEQPAAQEASP